MYLFSSTTDFSRCVFPGTRGMFSGSASTGGWAWMTFTTLCPATSRSTLGTTSKGRCSPYRLQKVRRTVCFSEWDEELRKQKRLLVAEKSLLSYEPSLAKALFRMFFWQIMNLKVLQVRF